MESIITFVVVLIISAVATMIKKVAQKQSEDASSLPKTPPLQPGQRPTMTTPQRKVVSWEDELRRLLGDESPLPRRPEALPRPLIPQRPVPPAPPVQKTRPTAVPPVVQSPAPTQKVSAVPAPGLERAVAAKEQKLLAEASRAHERAANLHKQATEHAKKISSQSIVPPTVVARPPAAPQVSQALSLVRNAQAAREAIVASIIIGPPKALEPIQ